MRSLASSCRADVGRMTKIERKIRLFAFSSLDGSENNWTLTFVTAIELRFADESWTVAHIAAQEGICRVGIATTNVAVDLTASATIMPLILTATT